jgi:DNA mismatch repair protein MutS
MQALQTPWCSQRLADLQALSLLNAPELSHLLCSIADDPAAQVRDGGVFAAGFNEELDRLRNLGADIAPFLLQMEATERARTGIATLRVEYNKVQGFFIEVSKGQADAVPEHYRRRQTLKNAERFITPELKAFEDQALSAKDRALALEKQLYDELLLALQPYVAVLQTAAHTLAGVDVLAATAHHSALYAWSAAELMSTDTNGSNQYSPKNTSQHSSTRTAHIDIVGGRHPVLEARIERFTPNDCQLNNDVHMLLITGPNMGGKSTYMRQVALIAGAIGSHWQLRPHYDPHWGGG